MMLLEPAMKSSPTRLVVIDNDDSVLMKLNGRGASFTTQAIRPSADILPIIRRRRPHALVIGRGIEFSEALRLCRLLREEPILQDMPIIVVSSRTRDGDEMEAFAAGADEYISSSSGSASLTTRINALVRRQTRQPHSPLEDDDVIRVGPLTIVRDSYSAMVNATAVPLTAGEFRLLWKLARNIGRTLSADQLAEASFDPDEPPSQGAVRSRVFSLRQKLGSAGQLIQTVRSAGYRMTP